MLDRLVIDALQAQFNRERYNREVYRCLADNLENVFWAGSAAFMRGASNEESDHADKFAAYLIDHNVAPDYQPIPAPPLVSGEDLLPYFEAAYALEVGNTVEIKNLDYLCDESEDSQTCIFLIWAIEEQTKAERELVDIITMLKRLDNNGRVIFDQQLGGK